MTFWTLRQHSSTCPLQWVHVYRISIDRLCEILAFEQRSGGLSVPFSRTSARIGLRVTISSYAVFPPNTPASRLNQSRVEVLSQQEPVEHHRKCQTIRNQLKRDSSHTQFPLRDGFQDSGATAPPSGNACYNAQTTGCDSVTFIMISELLSFSISFQHLDHHQT